MLAAYLVIFFGTVAIATSRRCMTTGIVVIDRTYGNYMSNETFFKMTDKIRLNTGGKDDDSFECDEFDAVDQDRTSRCLQMCKCTEEASTFSHFDGEWTCVENEEFREGEGKWKNRCVIFFLFKKFKREWNFIPSKFRFSSLKLP